MEGIQKAQNVLLIGALLILGVWSSTPVGETADPRREDVVASQEFPADWWSIVQQEMMQAEYDVTWQEQTYLADVLAAYQAPNRAQNLRSYFLPEGLAVIPRSWSGDSGTPPWRWQVKTIEWGRASEMQPVGEAEIAIRDNISEYRYGSTTVGMKPGLTAWYRNQESGLVQGFALETSPVRDQTGEQLQVVLAFDGGLVAHLAKGDTAVEFFDRDGAVKLFFGTPHAWDAAGKELPAWLMLDGATLSVFIDDEGANYPLNVESEISGLPPDYDWALTLAQAGAEFGYSVGSAGDVNGDGYSDVIVGVRSFDGGQVDEGRAYVFHGSASGLSTSPDWYKESDQTEARFGWSVATAGDVNGDGYADVIIGAPEYDNGQEDEGGAWVYHGSATGLEALSANSDEGNQAGAEFGYSVGTAGDVNGDGYADIIVGAPSYDNGEAGEGRVWVWHGSPLGVSESHDWRAEINQEFASFGISVATAGDVNADGFADVIIGAYGYTHGQTAEGVAFMWHGDAEGINHDVDGDQTNAAWMGEIDDDYAHYGRSVSSAGDVNGDGYSDVIVGAPHYTNGQADEGGAWLYLGSSEGLESSYANQDEGNQEDAWFGHSVSSAGDVNGDGYADVIVGAPLYTNGQLEEGKAWVWYGSPTGISTTNDWNVESDYASAWFGTCVATAGDVNGDGYSDVIIGAYGYDGVEVDGGRAYVYHGSPDPLSTSAGWEKRSNRANALFGFSVATAGDVDGDGLADVIVGSPRWDGGQIAEGQAWVYLGKSDGLSTAPAWYKQSDQEFAEYGYSVGTAGDINGDGYSDVIVGAPGYDYANEDEGMVWVYPGFNSGLGSAPIWSKYSNEAGARFGTSVGTAGDVNGDGYSEVIVGAPYYFDEGGAWVYLGSGDGLQSAPHWRLDCNQADSECGFSVGTAGDVNGDGYSDVIVGAPKWDGSEINEGRVWVHHGSMSGLSSASAWEKSSNRFGANFGYAVGAAGDVNGDGYSDVIIGAPNWNENYENEGGAWIYGGSSVGLESAPAWYKRSNQTGAHFGISVSGAGDVNGDGYADIVVGADLWDGGQPGELNEGGAWVYYGSAGGAHTVPDWYTEGNQASAHYGASVSSAGDVNGDGYADVIVGAPNYDSSSELLDEGQVYLYYGNGRMGYYIGLAQLTMEGSPIAPLGRSDAVGFMIANRPVHPFGRGEIKIEFEVKPLGQNFDGTGTYFPLGSDYWFKPFPWMGHIYTVDVQQLETPYHWRVRVLYNPATNPFLPASRWLTIPWNGWNETDLRTSGNQVFLPMIHR